MTKTREESQTTDLAEENQTSIAKENKQVSMPKKAKTSIPENQTIVTYTGYELVSFKDNVVSKNTKNVQVHPYAVCSLSSRKNTANKLISMQFQSKKYRSFSNTYF